MKIEKEAAVSRRTDETKTNMVASIEFAVRASLREEYVDADFVHPILGRVFAKSEDLGDEEDAGYIKASLVQFGEGLDHGISTDRLGDGIEGSIAECWELLFDLETGYWREECQQKNRGKHSPTEIAMARMNPITMPLITCALLFFIRN